ncbi:MAG: hypothetical protein AMXMBFR7_12590 [Planctomycetota bacterium]
MWDRLVALFVAPPKRIALSPALRRTLQDVPFVRRLDATQQRRFVKLVCQFLQEVTFECPPGPPVTDGERAWIAASCALLFAGRPEWSFPPVSRVLVTHKTFDDKTYAPRDGGAYHGVYFGGPAHRRHVALTRATLAQSFELSRDGYHLGVHEFAHALDDGDDDAELDGVPTHLPPALLASWLAALSRAQQGAREGRGVLRAYGGTHPRETFAVAVETFYEQPIRMRAQEPDLYALLRSLFDQDPAAYDEGQLRLQLRARARRLHEEMVRATPEQPRRHGRLTWEATARGLAPSVSYVTRAGGWSRAVRPSSEQIDVRLPRRAGGVTEVDLELDAGLTRRIRPRGSSLAVTRALFARLLERLKQAYPDCSPAQCEDALWHALERPPAVEHAKAGRA